MSIQQSAIFDREFCVRFEEAVLQLNVVDFVWRRFQRYLYRTFVSHC